MKRCSKCGQEKELGEFSKQKLRKDGLHSWCTACMREKDRKYRQKNRELILGKQKKRYEEDPEKFRKRARDDYGADPDKLRKRSRDWRKRNPEKALASSRKAWAKTDRFKVALQCSRRAAKRGGYEPCDATLEEIKVAFTGRCAICGVSELECFKRLTLDHAHDRKTGNFRGWLCGRCNSALGFFNDNSELLIDGLHYLMSYEQQKTK